MLPQIPPVERQILAAARSGTEEEAEVTAAEQELVKRSLTSDIAGLGTPSFHSPYKMNYSSHTFVQMVSSLQI